MPPDQTCVRRIALVVIISLCVDCAQIRTPEATPVAGEYAMPREVAVPREVIVKLAATAVYLDRRAFEACAHTIGVSVAPLHPETTDRELASYFIARVSADAVERVVSELRKCPGVDAAYMKPAAEPPEGK